MKKIIVLGLIFALGMCCVNISQGQTTKPPVSSPIDKTPLTRGTFIEIAQRVTPFVVNVFNMGEEGIFKVSRKDSGGTGFIIDGKKGLLLTNNHVVRGAKSLMVTLNDKRSLKAEVLGTDPIYDVALVRIINPPTDLRQVSTGNSDKVAVGEWVMAIGQPLFMDYTVTAGIVSALGREIQISGKTRKTSDYLESYIQSDALINPGNSGGPLFNLNGDVIGINTAGGRGYGYSIPINAALDIKEKILKDGKVIRAYLGILGSDFDDFLANSCNTTIEEIVKGLGLKEAKGVYILGNLDDSPAAAAGFKEEDVIIEFDGKKVDDLKSYRAIIGKLKPNSEVKVKFIREKKEETANIKLGELVFDKSAETEVIEETE